MKEKDLYEPIWENLKNLFLNKYDGCCLEITHNGKYSEDLKATFDRDILFFFKGRLSPDLTGFIVKDSLKRFIVVEIKKGQIKLPDIYQAKIYADFFRAEFCFLISSKPIPEEIKRVLKERPEVANGYAYKPIFLAQYDIEKGRILEYSWFPENPFL